jgi:hypothetical protein
MTSRPVSQAETHQQNRMHKPFGRMNTLFAIGTHWRVSSCVQISEIDANLRALGSESDQRPNDRCVSEIRRATAKLLSCALLPNYSSLDYAFASVDSWAGRPRFEQADAQRSTPRHPTYVERVRPGQSPIRAKNGSLVLTSRLIDLLHGDVIREAGASDAAVPGRTLGPRKFCVLDFGFPSRRAGIEVSSLGFLVEVPHSRFGLPGMPSLTYVSGYQQGPLACRRMILRRFCSRAIVPRRNAGENCGWDPVCRTAAPDRLSAISGFAADSSNIDPGRRS